MAGKNSTDKKHGKPTTAEHFSPHIERRILARATRAMNLSGVPNEMAKAILKTPLRNNA